VEQDIAAGLADAEEAIDEEQLAAVFRLAGQDELPAGTSTPAALLGSDRDIDRGPEGRVSLSDSEIYSESEDELPASPPPSPRRGGGRWWLRGRSSAGGRVVTDTAVAARLASWRTPAELTLSPGWLLLPRRGTHRLRAHPVAGAGRPDEDFVANSPG